MRSAKDFFQPMAIGAPAPPREIPFTPSRMIHFFDPSNEKMAAKVPDMAKKCDVLLGNLEDAVQADNKVAAREGLVKIANATDFGDCQLWTRVNCLESPWFLDDIMTLVTEAGEKLDVIMIPKVEGAWDIHYVDRILAQLEARADFSRAGTVGPGRHTLAHDLARGGFSFGDQPATHVPPQVVQKLGNRTKNRKIEPSWSWTWRNQP